VGVVQKVLEGVPSQGRLDPEQLRQRLCTAAIDYSFFSQTCG
jgi:hypothetical protein